MIYFDKKRCSESIDFQTRIHYIWFKLLMVKKNIVEAVSNTFTINMWEISMGLIGDRFFFLDSRWMST